MRVRLSHWAIAAIFAVSTGMTACSRDSPPASAATDSPAPAAQSPEGFLEGVSCDTVIGWAWNPLQPGAAVTIDVYEGDRLLGTTVADRFRQDLLDARKGTGRHAFVHQTPAELKDGRPHSIRAVVKGTSVTLTPLRNVPPSMTCGGQ